MQYETKTHKIHTDKRKLITFAEVKHHQSPTTATENLCRNFIIDAAVTGAVLNRIFIQY